MGEVCDEYRPEFNGSIRVEARPERLTAEAGAILLRDCLERLGVIDLLANCITDTRRQDRITHPMRELLATSLLLAAMGWRDQDDADALRNDPTMRLAVSSRRGTAPLETPLVDDETGQSPLIPDGLASQPTLSRTDRILSTEQNRRGLRDTLRTVASRRIRGMRPGEHRLRHVMIDVDSLPIDVHGHQPGSAHNGYYHGRVYHPIVAMVGETGDILDARLRAGNAHTAEGALEFVIDLVDEVERELCQVAGVRLDAGFPEDNLLCALEGRGIGYVARVKNNPVLDRMAAGFLTRPDGRRPTDPREWTYEMTYKAKSWTRPRRVVLVVQERAEELHLHHFWLITNWGAEQMPDEALVEMYRRRGTAEGHLGELKDVLDPALSSTSRQKSHYKAEPPARRYPPGDSFAINEVQLLMTCIAYNTMHIPRTLMEQATRTGWSLRRLRERVLRVAARILTHSRRATFVISTEAARHWNVLTKQIERLRFTYAPS